MRVRISDWSRACTQPNWLHRYAPPRWIAIELTKVCRLLSHKCPICRLMSYKVVINHIVDIICWVIIIPIAVVIRMLLPVTTRFGSVLFIGSMGRQLCGNGAGWMITPAGKSPNPRNHVAGYGFCLRMKFGNSPFHVVLCVGLDDWQRAREWNACPNDVHICWVKMQMQRVQTSGAVQRRLLRLNAVIMTLQIA